MDRGTITFSKANQTHGQTGVSIADAQKNAKYSKLGENKGLHFKFKEGETVYFPKPDECLLVPKKIGTQDVLHIPAFSPKRNRFVQIPLSMFRRVPVYDEEVDSFFNLDDRAFNVLLAELDYDVERARVLCEVGAVECKQVIPMHRAWIEFDQAQNKWVRIDGKDKPLDVFDLQPIPQNDIEKKEEETPATNA